MRHIGHFLTILLVLGCCLLAMALPQRVSAALGDASAEYTYNAFSDLRWKSAAGFCADPPGVENVPRECFYLSNDPYLTKFDRISVPQSPDVPYILGREANRGYWVIVDTHWWEEVINTYKEEEALARWESLGLQPPQFVNAEDRNLPFTQTEASRREQWVDRAIYQGGPMALMIALFALPMMLLLGRWGKILFARYREEGIKKHLYWSILCWALNIAIMLGSGLFLSQWFLP